MARKKGQSGFAGLINAVGFIFAVLLVLHAAFVLTGFRGENELANSVARAAEPLALFFPGLVEAPSEVLQVLLDYGLAAMFWVLVAGVVGRIFN